MHLFLLDSSLISQMFRYFRFPDHFDKCSIHFSHQYFHSLRRFLRDYVKASIATYHRMMYYVVVCTVFSARQFQWMLYRCRPMSRSYLWGCILTLRFRFWSIHKKHQNVLFLILWFLDIETFPVWKINVFSNSYISVAYRSVPAVAILMYARPDYGRSLDYVYTIVSTSGVTRLRPGFNDTQIQ